jgi:hypothetical protein
VSASCRRALMWKQRAVVGQQRGYDGEAHAVRARFTARSAGMGWSNPALGRPRGYRHHRSMPSQSHPSGHPASKSWLCSMSSLFRDTGRAIEHPFSRLSNYAHERGTCPHPPPLNSMESGRCCVTSEWSARRVAELRFGSSARAGRAAGQPRWPERERHLGFRAARSCARPAGC